MNESLRGKHKQNIVDQSVIQICLLQKNDTISNAWERPNFLSASHPTEDKKYWRP